MKIAEVKVERFRYVSNVARDADGHGHPGAEHPAVQSMLTISTDDGVSGHAFGGINPDVLKNVVEPVLLAEHPFYRERIWHALKERQRLNLSTLPDRILTVVD